MTAWIVMGCMFVLSAVLQVCPVSAEVSYEEDFSLRIGYLFVRYRVYPRPERKGKKRKPEKAPKPEKGKYASRVAGLLHREGLAGFLGLLEKVSRVALGSAKKLMSHTVVDLLVLDLSVGGEDAAQTALNYGRACGVVSTALGALSSAAKCRRRSVRVAPDFQSGKSSVRFRVRIKIRLFFLISAALAALIGFLKIYKKYKRQSGLPDQKKKAVHS